MTELQHLQSIILSIVKDVNDLCRKYNIEYYLNGGSCIGAIRHNGFIPWDDDLDIMMTKDNHEKFISACRSELDPAKYYIQEALIDWPLNFTKIRLKGTIFHEPEDEYATEAQHGIYIDVFILENSPDNRLLGIIQYILSKYNLCYLLGKRKYKVATLKKKIMIAMALPMRIAIVRKVVTKILDQLQNLGKNKLGHFYGVSRLKNAIMDRSVYGTPKYVKFEDTELPVPEDYHEYLTRVFGDYMELPPEDQRKGHHLISIDFGKY